MSDITELSNTYADRIMAIVPPDATEDQIDAMLRAGGLMIVSLAMAAYDDPEAVIVAISKEALAVTRRNKAALAGILGDA